MSIKRHGADDPDWGKMPAWWKVWAGVCLMVSVGLLALGTWAVVSLVNWVTSR